MRSGDKHQREQMELENERIRSEIALNIAQTKKLTSRSFVRPATVALGVLAAVWAFAATFTGFLTDLSEISKKELPKAREQVEALQAQNETLKAANDSLAPEKARADSLQVALLQALAALFELGASPVTALEDSCGLVKEFPWLSSVLMIEIDSWPGPLIVALQDEEHGSGHSIAAGFRFDHTATNGQEFWGSWYQDIRGLRIDPNPVGVLTGHYSHIFIDVTRPVPAGGFVARWESSDGRGTGSAHRVANLVQY